MNRQILHDMGIDVWVKRADKPTMTIDQIEQKVNNCQACALAASRHKVVFGVGNQQAKLMVIGEAPGKDEDLQGEPFVGRAGKLLDAMLQAIGCDRTNIYIANILKCRPPDNRNPLPAEVDACITYLKQQIEMVNPKVLLCVGLVATQNLLQSTQSMAQLRGKIHKFGDVPLVACYHPAYLLRSPRQKAAAWEDLKIVLKLMGKN